MTPVPGPVEGVAVPELPLEALAVGELALLTSGADAWTTHPLPDAGIPALKLSDGPNGVRGRGGPESPPSACFPVATALAATWDVDLVGEVGRALGAECRARAAHVLLGPTLNLHRSPLAGRNFECFSEDPHLAARMGVAVVQGVQSEGVAACVKHLVANDSEFERYTLSADVPARALRELYLVPFEAAVREGGAWAVMTAYNRLHGIACSAHEWLLSDVLKGEWGFDGLVVSDWGGTYETLGPARAGLDLEMPGPARFFGPRLAAAVEDGQIARDLLVDKARRLARLTARTRAAERPADAEERAEDTPALRGLARRAAAESMVLLRNEDDVLPLHLEAGQRLLVVGPNAAAMTIMGGGSSQVRPHPVSQPLPALRAHFEALGVEVHYEPGWRSARFTGPLLAVDGFELTAEPTTEFTRERTTERTTELARAGDHVVPLGRVQSIAVDVLDTDGPGAPPGSRLRWRGRYVPQRSGEHQFGVAATGAASLTLDGELVVDVPAVGQGPTFFGFGSEEVRGAATLVAGRAHDLEVLFTQPEGRPVRGLRVGVDPPETGDLAGRALGAARRADAAVVVVGLDTDWEGEGADRASFDLPGRQAEVAEAVSRICPRTAVVVNAGSPVRLDWAERAGALVYAWYPGMEAGNALVDVLTGQQDFAGRLPTTFPRRLEDTPSFLDYPGEAGRVRYAEGVFLGYRGYDARDIEPAFPFGFGLSFTTFAYGPLTVEVGRGPDVAVPSVTARVTVTNTGARAGSEVVQLYAAGASLGHRGRVSRPPKELVGFRKVRLAAGETTTVRFELGARAFAFWDEAASSWAVDPGRYELLAGSSSRHLPSTATLDL